ncbi:hypothetical protein UlMin_010782 [Ulmus minor]
MTFSLENQFKSYDIEFHGDCIKTIVTTHPKIIDQWVLETYNLHGSELHNLLVGLDTEWRLIENNSSKRKIVYQVALLQLCVHNRCLILQNSPCEFPRSLVDFLGNPHIRFVGVGVGQDAKMLRKDWHLCVERAEDVGFVAAERYNDKMCKNMGLKDLAKKVLHKEMAKPTSVTTSNWDVPELSFDQVEYACIDAFVSFLLGMELIL